jgi:hypothetical protein
VIQLSRLFARQVRNVLRKAFGRSLPASLMIQSSFTGLAIRCQHEGIAVLYQSHEGQGDESLFLPSQALTDIEGKSHDIVALEATGKNIVAHWTDAGVPRVMEYEAGKTDTFSEFPQTPTRFAHQDDGLVKALDDAMQTTSKDAIRFVLNKIQIRGKTGVIAATDGHQLLYQNGFQFSFDEDILIPRTNAFQCKELQGAAVIAKTKTHFCVRVDPWTIFFLIDQDGRFPNVDSIIPKVDASASHVRLQAQDIAFLSNALTRLPGNDQDRQSAVTLELNGQAVVRAKDEKQSTEVVLSGAGVSGKPIRYALNRQNLVHALELGFTDGYVFDVDKPMLFQDDRRKLVFTGLGKDHVVLHSPNDVCLRSDLSEPVNHHQTVPNQRRNEPMKASRPPATMAPTQPVRQELGNGHPTESDSSANGNGQHQEKVGFNALLEETQSIQNGLRDLLLRTNHLMAGLKSYRRQAKTVQSTLASLRQLQQVEA